MLKLVKTTSEGNGSPGECNCGSQEFVSSGLAWHCVNCKTYFPSQLGFNTIKRKIEMAEAITKDLKFQRDRLNNVAKD